MASFFGLVTCIQMQIYFSRECGGGVRTTLKMNDKLRSELLRLAAPKGEKSFSNIVQEAVAAYPVSSPKKVDLQRNALELKGSLKDFETKSLREETRKIRSSWR